LTPAREAWREELKKGAGRLRGVRFNEPSISTRRFC
jgi:hypothetical protein